MARVPTYGDRTHGEEHKEPSLAKRQKITVA